jgi:probable rRNA maturation factor
VIAFVSDRESQKWNRIYRHRDRPTNVLSFADLRTRPPMGEILIAQGVLRREAKERGLTLRDHASRLLVHGLLHIAGYDHTRKRDAHAMEKIEDWILQIT